jgi:hypothetical protein
MADSKQKHTPGEWEVSATGLITNDGQIAIMAPDERLMKKRVALIDCHTKFKRGEGWKVQCDERKANAILIAAAPNMLEALEAVISDREFVIAAGGTEGPLSGDVIQQFAKLQLRTMELVEAAIKKAKGLAANQQKEG